VPGLKEKEKKQKIKEKSLLFLERYTMVLEQQQLF